MSVGQRKNQLAMFGRLIVVVLLLLSVASAQDDPESLSQSEMESLDEIRGLIQKVQVLFETKVASKVRQETTAQDEEIGGMSDEEIGENDLGVEDEADVENGVAVDAEDAGNEVAVDEADAGNEVAVAGEVGEYEVDPNGCSCSRFRCSCCIRVRIVRWKAKKRFCLSLQYLRRHIGILVRLTYERRCLFSREISAKNPPPICTGIPYVRRAVSVCIQFNGLSVRRRTVSGCSKFLVRIFRRVILGVRLGCFRFRCLDANQQFGAAELPYFAEPEEASVKGPEPIFLREVQMSNVQPADFEKK